MEHISNILTQFGLDSATCRVERTGSGHINYTYLVSEPKRKFILQRINTNVFRQPELIATNLRIAADFLKIQDPDYLFLEAIRTTGGAEMASDPDGHPWRLFPYIPNTVTLDKVDTLDQAFEAARGFGTLTRKLDGIDVSAFAPTIPKFQDLSWRFEQLQQALAGTTEERRNQATDAIRNALEFGFLVDHYRNFTESGKLKPRVVHNDTKINNILFHTQTGKSVCVIDLDTLMPGYFIYDLGDMVRTFVSPVSEEEADTSKVMFRADFYEALLNGYLSVMEPCLLPEERPAVPFAGMMMTYIMAIRFLADFLNGNIYYQIHYPEQNLVRARNQLALVRSIGEALRYRS